MAKNRKELKKKKTVICLYGGPGTGKSTTAAGLFFRLKKAGVNAELVREYVKDWVWEDRKIKETDQVYILAKQARKEQICFEGVDVIVTDSPIRLCAIYEKMITEPPYVTPLIIQKFEKEAQKQGVSYIHVFLNRKKKYNPKGRLQNLEEAKELDKKLKSYLISENVNFIEVDADEKAPKKIIKLLNLL